MCYYLNSLRQWRWNLCSACQIDWSKSVQCLSNRLIMKRLNSHGLTFVSVKRIVGLHVFVLETQAKNIHMYKLHMDNCRRWQCFLVQSWWRKPLSNSTCSHECTAVLFYNFHTPIEFETVFVISWIYLKLNHAHMPERASPFCCDHRLGSRLEAGSAPLSLSQG